MALQPVLNRSLIFLLIFCFTLYGHAQQNSQSQGLQRPPYLKKGDTIMILSPAGRIKERSAVAPGIELANKWGLVVFFGNHMLSTDNSFAGTDAQRLEDLQKALDDPAIKAIWAARGGYGTVRIIDDLDFEGFSRNPNGQKEHRFDIFWQFKDCCDFIYFECSNPAETQTYSCSFEHHILYCGRSIYPSHWSGI